jgi:hypothetical protein
MSLPTPLFGLIKAAQGELYDVDIVNNNLDAIDAGLVKLDSANSTYNINSISGVSSRFTRLRIGSTGIIVAEFGLDIDTAAITIAASTAAATVLPGFIPAGYRPLSVAHSIPMMGVAPVTNAGSGAQLQWGFNVGGDLLLRSTGAAYTTVVGTDMNFFAVYKWDGVP